MRILSGHHNPNWKGGNITLKCMVCATDFEVKPVRKNKAKCCSLQCWNKFQKDTGFRNGVRKKQWISKECRQCGSSFEVSPCFEKMRYFCSPKCHFMWRSNHNSGSGNPNWNGGTRSEHYPYSFFAIRQSILQRDAFTCAVPMCRTKDARVSVHHIDYDKKNCEPLNLITACPSCNARANFNRQIWKRLLSSFIKWRCENSIMNLDLRGTVEIK